MSMFSEIGGEIRETTGTSNGNARDKKKLLQAAVENDALQMDARRAAVRHAALRMTRGEIREMLTPDRPEWGK